ncbi:MAG: hypothetical protein A2Y15_04015 [Clostridiales bacterium GWF2_36_10]|nr:MAG: hypothetical protein A2Y15_04015 [Clostridiales bacterium GWF2_36_10]
MIELKDISKIYRIDGKLFYAKSTLMHILGCLDNFNEGDYILNDMNISDYTAGKIAHLRNQFYGFVLQDFSLINHKTALYNVMTPMFFNKTPFHEMKKRALEALEKLGIPEQAKKDVVNMSGGQRQRVAIARAIVNNSSVILADEPTGNLDSVTADEIMNIFIDLNKEGKTIIIVTHDDHIASFCNRVINISDGKIVV